MRLLVEKGMERTGLGEGVLTMRDEKRAVRATLLGDTLQFDNGPGGVSVRVGSDIGHSRGGGALLWPYGSPQIGNMKAFYKLT